MKLPALIFAVLLAFICLLPAAYAAEGKPPTLHDKVYRFEHRVLPSWTYKSQGAFFADLQGGRLERIKSAAAESVSQEFADKLAVKVLSETKVLITFSEPLQPAECYFALIVKEGERFRYFTLEKTADLFDDGTKSVVGGWSDEGSHANYGPRKYDDAKRFAAENVVNGKS